MEFLQKIFVCSFLLLFLFSLSVISHSLFSPIDNYLVDCGSTVDSTIDNRNFVADSSSSISVLLTSARCGSLRNERPLADVPPIYNSARVFRTPSKYKFEIRDKGTHMVRIYFHSFSSSNRNLNLAQFHVMINGYVALSNFSGSHAINPIIKEYLIWVDAEKLVITFAPVKKTNFAFVNAIEVISAPKDLVADSSKYLTSEKIENVDGLTREAFEIVYRVNVGGPKVTPFNDTLWRTWVPDDGYLQSSEGSKRVYSGGRIMYNKGGASREVGPDNVYNTARAIKSINNSIPNVNMTWKFSVVGGYKYLVRLHFCDIASLATGLLYFNVYVNGYLAYENLDLSYLTYWVLASPYYADFVVDGDSTGILSIGIGPSNMSLPYAIDGILNGIEIMKLNNSFGSLDGDLSADLIMKTWPRENIGVLLPLVVVICLLVSISMVLRRRMIGMNESVAWSKLPVDASEVNLKQDNQKAEPGRLGSA